MEIIGVILFIAFFLINFGDKKKKAENAARKPGAPAATRPGTPAANARGSKPTPSAGRVKPVKPASAIPKDLDDLKGAMNRWLEDGVAEIKADVKPPVQPAGQSVQGASMLDDAQCAGGSMPHSHAEGHSTLADEDCAGGSMAHTHTEGVSRTAHARRMAAIDAGHPGGEDILPEAIDAVALRRAVVMAEVLGKPRALKKSRYVA